MCCSRFLKTQIIKIRYERDFQIGIIARAATDFVDNSYPLKIRDNLSSKVLSCFERQQMDECLPSLLTIFPRKPECDAILQTRAIVLLGETMDETKIFENTFFRSKACKPDTIRPEDECMR